MRLRVERGSGAAAVGGSRWVARPAVGAHTPRAPRLLAHSRPCTAAACRCTAFSASRPPSLSPAAAALAGSSIRPARARSPAFKACGRTGPPGCAAPPRRWPAPPPWSPAGPRSAALPAGPPVQRGRGAGGAVRSCPWAPGRGWGSGCGCNRRAACLAAQQSDGHLKRHCLHHGEGVSSPPQHRPAGPGTLPSTEQAAQQAGTARPRLLGRVWVALAQRRQVRLRRPLLLCQLTTHSLEGTAMRVARGLQRSAAGVSRMRGVWRGWHGWPPCPRPPTVNSAAGLPLASVSAFKLPTRSGCAGNGHPTCSTPTPRCSTSASRASRWAWSIELMSAKGEGSRQAGPLLQTGQAHMLQPCRPSRPAGQADAGRTRRSARQLQAAMHCTRGRRWRQQ